MSSTDLGAPAPVAPGGRRRIHTRTIVVEVYARDDGLYDLEGRLTDVKDHDLVLESGLRPAGQPVHDMHLSLTVDAELNVIQAGARSRVVPYPGACETIGPAYGALRGLNLLQKFRKAVMQVMGGARGCTHLSELAGVLPTAAVQALAGIRRGEPDEVQPFQLDRCHALVTSGESVRRFYPRWFRDGKAAGTV
jgi:Protein of unknown function (DUF2889)